MKKALLIGTAVLAIAMIAACSSSSSGGNSSPTPTPTATPTGPFSVTVDLTGWPHPGSDAYIRVLDTDSSNKVVLCQGPIVISGTSASATTAGVLTLNHHYRAEAWVDLNTDGNFDPAVGTAADHDYFADGATPATADMTITVAHGVNDDISWTANTACPGT